MSAIVILLLLRVVHNHHQHQNDYNFNSGQESNVATANIESIDGLAPAPVTIDVSLPEDAKLTIDDVLTTATSAHRSFVSPPLDRNMEYTYTLKGELLKDGRKTTAIKKITVRGGQETKVTLEFVGAELTAN